MGRYISKFRIFKQNNRSRIRFFLVFFRKNATFLQKNIDFLKTGYYTVIKWSKMDVKWSKMEEVSTHDRKIYSKTGR